MLEKSLFMLDGFLVLIISEHMKSHASIKYHSVWSNGGPFCIRNFHYHLLLIFHNIIRSKYSVRNQEHREMQHISTSTEFTTQEMPVIESYNSSISQNLFGMLIYRPAIRSFLFLNVCSRYDRIEP